MALIPGNWLSEAAQSNEGAVAWEVNANASGVTTSTTWAADGTQSVRWTATGDLAPQVRPITRPTKAAAGWADGTEYEARFTVYATRATNVRLIVNHKDAGGTNVPGGQFSAVIGATVAGTGVELSQALTIPAGTEQIEMVLFFNGRTGGTGDLCYADKVFLGVPVATDDPPTVTAPADVYVQAGEQVTLTATGSADVTAWSWAVHEDWAGEPVTLTGATTATVTLNAPRSLYGHLGAEALPLVVTVTDAAAQTAQGIVLVEVDPAPQVLVKSGTGLVRTPVAIKAASGLTWAGLPYTP